MGTHQVREYSPQPCCCCCTICATPAIAATGSPEFGRSPVVLGRGGERSPARPMSVGLVIWPGRRQVEHCGVDLCIEAAKLPGHGPLRASSCRRTVCSPAHRTCSWAPRGSVNGKLPSVTGTGALIYAVHPRKRTVVSGDRRILTCHRTTDASRRESTHIRSACPERERGLDRSAAPGRTKRIDRDEDGLLPSLWQKQGFLPSEDGDKM